MTNETAARFETLRFEFPDYDPETLPAIPDGWEDISWHNDACPSFEVMPETDARGAVRVWIDYPEPDRREVPGAARFVCFVDTMGGGDECTIYAGEDWQELLSAVLAFVFVETVRRVTTPDEFEGIRRRNADYKRQGMAGVCATHDVMDANEQMAEAFEAVTGRAPDVGSDDDARLWSAAWAWAMPELTGTPDETAAPIPGSVADYFAAAFPGHVLADDGDREAMESMPADCPCGADCVAAIDAGAAMLEQVRRAHGEFTKGEAFAASVADMTADVCGVYICG